VSISIEGMARAIRIYTTDWCGYCKRAVALLHKKGVAFDEIDATNVRDWLVSATGRRTVPQIFIDGVPIGGHDDLVALDRAGELDRILAGERDPASIRPGGGAAPPPPTAR
jgi:glutaredoxin 3